MSSTRIIFYLAVLLLQLTSPVRSRAAEHIDLFTDSCVAGTDYFEFRLFITNSSTAGETLYFNSATFRISHGTAIVPSGTQAYDFTHIAGTSDPQFSPLYSLLGSSYNLNYTPASRLLQIVYSNSILGNASSPAFAALPAGQTACLGAFRLSITSSPWIDNQPVSLGWAGTTSGVTVFVDTATSTTNMNTTLNRTLGGMCAMTTPTSTQVSGIQEATSLAVFPNPSSGEFQLRGIRDGETIRVISSDGIIQRNLRADGNDQTIFLNDLPKGIYLLETNTIRRRIVLQ